MQKNRSAQIPSIFFFKKIAFIFYAQPASYSYTTENVGEEKIQNLISILKTWIFRIHFLPNFFCGVIVIVGQNLKLNFNSKWKQVKGRISGLGTCLFPCAIKIVKRRFGRSMV